MFVHKVRVSGKVAGAIGFSKIGNSTTCAVRVGGGGRFAIRMEPSEAQDFVSLDFDPAAFAERIIFPFLRYASLSDEEKDALVLIIERAIDGFKMDA